MNDVGGGYVLDAGGVELRLEVIPVPLLVQHERVLPGVIQKLVYEFKNMAKLHDPVIVDDRHAIVLDGNHRAFVFKELGYVHIPVCKIDYTNELVQLKYWYRLVKGFGDATGLLAEIQQAGGVIEPAGEGDELRSLLMARPLSMGIQSGGRRLVATFPAGTVADGVSAYELVHGLERWIAARGHEVSYIPCQHMTDQRFCDTLLPGDLVLWTPHVSKEMVVDAAMAGKVFPPKSTRHVIPARPLNVNVPVHWFAEDASLEEINIRFTSFLDGKDVRRFGQGQIIDGRYYSEELFIFADRKA